MKMDELRMRGSIIPPESEVDVFALRNPLTVNMR
jgi:hypothetical protein